MNVVRAGALIAPIALEAASSPYSSQTPAGPGPARTATVSYTHLTLPTILRV